MDLPQTVKILDVEIDCVTTAETINRLLEFARKHIPARIAYVNPHCLNIACKDDDYKAFLDSADLIYPDGVGVSWLMRFLSGASQERVTASDFLPDFVKAAAEQGIKPYFLGGHPGTVERLIENFRTKIPGFEVAGAHHGFLSDETEIAVIDEINSLRPDIVILGMSVPVQEKWVLKNHTKIGAIPCWVVGGAFDFHSERRKRAPKIVMKLGLEWMYRFALEPRRLWRRYFVGNFVYLWRVIRYILVNR